jgi:hypothetical protein
MPSCLWAELRLVFVSTPHDGKNTMLRLLVCGSAKRVEDTVAHAINLQNREDYNEKRTLGRGLASSFSTHSLGA